MIVVAIIGILAAVAIPQYQNYVARAQAAEGFSLAGGLKTALAEYHNTHGVFPTAPADAHTELGIELAEDITGNYVESVTVSDDGSGTITATFGPGNHEDKFLRLTPTVTDGAISFNCTTDIEEDWRPSDCEESTGTGGCDGTGGGDGDATVVKPFNVDPPLDTDGDGVPDDDDNCPSDSTNTDTDGDGACDITDLDDDGDGINDDEDAFPLNSAYSGGESWDPGNMPAGINACYSGDTGDDSGVWVTGTNTVEDHDGMDSSDRNDLADTGFRCRQDKPSSWYNSDGSCKTARIGAFGGVGYRCCDGPTRNSDGTGAACN